jgi:hypothetical protein
MELVDGLNKCSNAEYHADRKYLSSSVLKTILKSLDTYREKYIEKKPEEPRNRSALEEGSLAHSLVLEPELVDKEYIFWNGWRKAGKEWDDFKAGLAPDQLNKTIISAPQKHRVEKLVKTMNALAPAKQLFTGGESEATLCGTLHDVPIKVRFDYINVDKSYIVDLKTTGYSGELDSFKQTIKDLNYDLSAGLYTAMVEQFYGKKFDFYFVVLSKRDEDCQIYKISDETMGRGKRLVLDA